MSVYADLVAAESVEDDDEEQAADETEADDTEADETEAADGPAEAIVPAFDEKALEKELKRHSTAVAKALGEGFMDMKPCEACGTMGYVPQDFEPEPVLLADPNLAPCPACNGHGLVITGSLHPEHLLERCTKCAGAGYRDKAQIEAEAVAARVDVRPSPQYSPPPQPVWDDASQRWVIPDPAASPASSY